eukprot:3088789-Lingulodinium_polyedra.AAC.1
MERRPFVTAVPAMKFARALWASMLVNVGQVQDHRLLAQRPACPRREAARVWADFRAESELRV